ncbi:hypothetical protein O181_109660, partial [Austropuccinia psidii MF-1]|nr:hypothetical protein [Austropuccinia psidii MF-1]
MTQKQTCAMGQGQLTLYSLVLQPPPLFKHYYQAIRPVISPRSLVTKCTTCISAWGTCALHPPCTLKGPHNHPPASSHPRHPRKDSFVVNNDETISKRKWTPGPQAGQREQLWTISPVPSSINLSTPPPRPPSNGHFTPQPEQSDYLADEGWQWREDIRAWADRHHVLSPMGFKCQKQNPPNPPRQDSPVPSLPRKQTPRQPTPGPSGTRWSEELFC